MKSRSHGKSGRQLPGWGRVANPADWKVVDDADDNDHGGAAAVSRIVAQMQPLDLSSGYPALATEEAGTAPQPGPPSLAATDVSSKPAVATGPAAPTAAPSIQDQHVQEDAVEEEEAEGEGDEWAVAGKSKNAERHRRRKQIRWEGRQPQQQQDGSSGPSGRSPLTEAATTTSAAAVAAAAAKAMQEEEEEEEQVKQGEGDAPMSDDGEDGEDMEEESDSDEDSDDDDEEEEDGEEGQEEGEEGTAGGSEVGTETTAADEVLHINTTSTILSVTSDFAMQNVLLQMGLRLVTRDGQQISR